MEWFKAIINQIYQRIEKLERSKDQKKITIPSDGFFIVDSQTSDPPVANGRIYYNTTSNSLRACINGVWKTVTVS